MPDSPNSLSYELHKLTARLDRAADALLREQAGVSYPRFLALFAVTQGVENQRALSRWLGQSEPSTSRMVGVLAKAGWLEVSQTPGAGNRRQLKLTRSGSQLVAACGELLENRFSELVAKAGIAYEAYLESTRRLLVQLDEDQERVRPGRGSKH
jgi:DNA-binding MarR family transcriptional regulator